MKFTAEIKMLGINPYVDVPEKILQDIFKKSGKDKGSIPIRGSLNGAPYKQTLIRHGGDWRLYINTTILHNSPRRIGEIIKISAEYDPEPRSVIPHPKFIKALNKNKKARITFESLPASRRLEIVRYLTNLKTDEALERNILRAIQFLLGKERFVGRDKP